MDKIKDIDIYCSHCKTKIGKFIKNSYNKKSKVQYYSCNECNTKKSKKYRHTLKGKENFYKASYKSMAKWSVKQCARAKLFYAIKRGKIIKPIFCSNCGKITPVEGHHKNYNLPFEVQWLCRSCHTLFH